MSWSQGKLIVIEGSDGAGKATQTDLLLKKLEKKHHTSFFEFPRYKHSAFGQLIRRSLAGEFGDFLALSPYLSSLPYVIDRTRAKYLLQEALKEGNVICDRYTPSNLAHQGAKLPKKEQNKFFDFIEQGEYKELGLPMPDIVIYLYLPAIVSQKLLVKRSIGKEKRILDQHEIMKDYQSKVVETYLSLVKRRKNWHIISCVDSKGKLLNRNKIHAKVLSIIRKELKFT